MIRWSTQPILLSTMFVSKTISYILIFWQIAFFLLIITSLLKFNQEDNMFTIWIILTLYLSIGFAEYRDIRLKINCSTMLNKQLFHLHSGFIILRYFTYWILLSWVFLKSYTFVFLVYNFLGERFPNHFWNKMFQREMLYTDFFGKTWYAIKE